MTIYLAQVVPEILGNSTKVNPPAVVAPADPVGSVPIGLAVGALIVLAVLLLAAQEAHGKRKTSSFVSSDRRMVFMDLLGLGAAMGSLLGTDAATGGWIVGGIFTGTLFVVGILVTSAARTSSPLPLMMFLVLGLGLSTGFGWFPVWMFFGVFLISAASVIGVLSNRSEGSGM